MAKKAPRSASPDSKVSSSRSSARRRIVTGGVVAGTTSVLLPVQWLPPVVQAVILPAHAVTSPQACTPLTLNGCQANCADDPKFVGTRYTFEIVDGCIIATQEETTQGPQAEDQLRIICRVEGEVAKQLTLIVEVVGSPLAVGTQQCDNPASPHEVPFALDLTVATLPFIATGTITVATDEIVVSPIQVDPA